MFTKKKKKKTLKTPQGIFNICQRVKKVFSKYVFGLFYKIKLIDVDKKVAIKPS